MLPIRPNPNPNLPAIQSGAVKRKALEMALQRRPRFPHPDASLEQYLTPAPVAADILYWALSEGDVEGRSVLDLGCGTGTFSVGAALLGAKSVVGADVDRDALALARRFAAESGADVGFVAADVRSLPLGEGARFDAALMNPPFGSQRSHADRPFVEAALRRCSIVYSIHMGGTEPFVRLLVEKLGGRVLAEKIYKFDIPHTYRFHEREATSVRVSAFRVGMVMR
jgi:putative methylase